MSAGHGDVHTPSLVIYGAGGFAREVAWLAESCPDVGAVVALLNDDAAEHGRVVNDIPVMGLSEARRRFPDARFVIGVGDPHHRQRMAERVTAAGGTFATLIHPRVERSRWIEIGEGTVICAGNMLTTNIVLGRHVQINLTCTVGHDVVMGDFATLAPGVCVSGRVRIGARAYLGTGASVINGTADTPLVIGDDAIVGAGACVVRPVAAGTTVMGVPARPRDARP
jgi:sugar O-acyltransferase (sialic acid O-acetyltransferase NeuD family)